MWSHNFQKPKYAFEKKNKLSYVAGFLKHLNFFKIEYVKGDLSFAVFKWKRRDRRSLKRHFLKHSPTDFG